MLADAEAEVAPARVLRFEHAAAGDVGQIDSFRSAAPPNSSGTAPARALIASALALRVGMPSLSP